MFYNYSWICDRTSDDGGFLPCRHINGSGILFLPTEEMVEYLQQQGTAALLCRDSEEASYNLTEEQVKELYTSRDGKLEVAGMTYYVTDLRLEKENIVDTLEERKNDRVIVLFTHAWSFEENSEKLEESIQWLLENEYQFSDLEPVVEE